MASPDNKFCQCKLTANFIGTGRESWSAYGKYVENTWDRCRGLPGSKWSKKKTLGTANGQSLRSLETALRYFEFFKGCPPELTWRESYNTWVLGGGLPRRVQSVMLRPDSVSRVMRMRQYRTWVLGGGLPRRVQSVMLRPDSVSRVTPPRATAPIHIPVQHVSIVYKLLPPAYQLSEHKI